ncbi:MAG: hypothetical protein ACRD3G_04930 [Vicinamibacterales bacterium]
MRPDSAQPSDQPASGDALSLFTYEPEGSNPVPVTTAKAPGAVSLDRVVEAAPLRFVEGIAVVQALCAAIREKGGINAGMLDLRGVFINEGGELVALTPPGGTPAAPELARLLHQLVPADATPPVARLFIDRWTGGTSTDLAAFASEIAYFARPNGRELLTALHVRCAGAPGAAPQLGTSAPAVVPTFRVEERPKVEESEKPEPRRPSWLRSHKRHIAAAAAAIAVTVAVTGLATWFWPSKAAVAAQVPAQTALETPVPSEAPGEEPGKQPVKLGAGAAPAKSLTGRPTSEPRVATQPRVAANGRRNVPAPAASSLLPKSPTQEGIGPVSASPTMPESAAVTAVPSRGLPDMRIYSSADSGIEPPRLRSAEILEGLIAGFPTKTNAVEVLVDRAGKVERVRMQGTPQRIPDIVILSRMKEWVFDPATKDGTAVRYRMILTWDVTP